MGGRSLFTLILLCCSAGLAAQTAPEHYWVRFTTKAGTPFDLAQPEDYPSPRALERRARYGIAIDSTDLPIDPAFLNELLAWGDFRIVNRSKWNNAVTIRTTDTLALDTLHLAPFVAQVKCTRRAERREGRVPDKFGGTAKTEIGDHYQGIFGPAYRQLSMMNAHLLQERAEARGEGMLIGVLDSGFDGVDSSATFAALRARGGIVHAQDMAFPGSDIYQEHWHGRSVLSVMAGTLPGAYQGAAPMADYALFRTEVESSEYIWEEDNWIAGAEVADSLGCDVLSTSLGYTTFEDSLTDHTYADMDGATTRISIAAGRAAAKGMLVVNSAGNSGQSEWYHISAPADAFGILSVGAVNDARTLAPFSSRGPSSDGRIKPEVAAVGLGTQALSPWGEGIIGVNGTSFSCPLMAGSVACLWQLHRDRTPQEIIAAVLASASQHAAPDNDLGHGIPDLWRAHLLLLGRDLTNLSTTTFMEVFPVPFGSDFNVEVFTGEAQAIDLRLVDMSGREVWSAGATVDPGTYQQIHVGDVALQRLNAGAYLLRMTMGDKVTTRRVVKVIR